jgi:D-aminopeptidase
MIKELLVLACTFSLTTFSAAQNPPGAARLRASELGLKVGVLPTGQLDAITDVSGVDGDHYSWREHPHWVTAILPHAGNLYREKVPAGIFVGSGFGKLAGSTQVEGRGRSRPRFY